jgi:glycerol uptake facilitator-like aquaporin
VTSQALPQRVAAELVGTAFLVAAVVGSGVAAQRLSPHDVGLQLLQNAVATGAALVALILALQPVSASFNPIITLVERAFGIISSRAAAALVAGQITGGVVGVILANLMFALPPVMVASTARGGPGQWLAEVVATAGLVMIVFGAARTGRADRVAYAVGGYITAAYWFTSSTSFANPAVTISRMFSDTFTGIQPASVPGFLAAQVAGGAVGYLLARNLFPAEQPALVPTLAIGQHNRRGPVEVVRRHPGRHPSTHHRAVARH